jgi:hypothetical protein
MAFSSFPRALAPSGNEPYCRGLWTGPSSYTRVGTTPVASGGNVSNGDPLAAATIGVNMIVSIEVAVSWTGNYLVLPIRVSEAKYVLKWIALVTGTAGGQSQTAYTEAVTGTDLSGEYVKLWINTLTG